MSGRGLRIALAAAVMATAGAGGGVTASSAAEESEKAPSGLALEGLDKLLQALQLFIENIPQYESPYINEEGDIIIRRKRGPEEAPPEDKPEETRAVDRDSVRI
jgi:hypothetical protein